MRSARQTMSLARTPRTPSGLWTTPAPVQYASAPSSVKVDPMQTTAAQTKSAGVPPAPTLSLMDCFSSEEAARRSYPLLMVSLLGTALSFYIGMAAIYEMSGHYVMPLLSWAWLITSQCIYAAALWVTCYSCVSNSFISPQSSTRAVVMHPYLSQMMSYLFITGMQTTLVWVMYTSMDSTDRELFDGYRHNATKPAGYNMDFNIFWRTQLYGFVCAMIGALFHLTGAWKYQSPADGLTKPD